MLELLDHHTGLLVATVADLSASDLGEDSRCGGWTRGHVVAHVARNADAIGNLTQWALTGEPHAMYPAGLDQRDADIEAGAHRSPEIQQADLRGSADALRPQLVELVDRGAMVETVEGRGGVTVRSASLPFMRLREVVFHHVDLATGFSFAEVEAPLMAQLVADAVRRLSGSDLSVALVADEGPSWTLGEGTQAVTGSLAGLLTWLARQDPSGVSSTSSLPAVPQGN